ncbi:MAG: class I SAM-dependent methyltransferase [Acetobacteraceae bacterium]
MSMAAPRFAARPGHGPTMSGFSAHWLALREPVDARSRDPGLLGMVRDVFSGHAMIRIVDLGCGTGASLRALAPHLGARQDWTLIDHDPVLLDAARAALAAWADTATPRQDGLVLVRAGQTITVRCRSVDLARNLDDALTGGSDLVTASAFFDLVSAGFIQAFATAAAKRGAAVYATLTYDGVQAWEPPHPGDTAIQAAFNAHQGSDKGFGPAAGPVAPALLADTLAASGFQVICRDSPWHLGAGDIDLLRMLLSGVADAVAETGRVDPAILARWRDVRRHAGRIGHIDTLALPSRLAAVIRPGPGAPDAVSSG